MATERSLVEASKCLEGVVLMEIFDGYSAPASAWPERPSKEELRDRIAEALDATQAEERERADEAIAWLRSRSQYPTLYEAPSHIGAYIKEAVARHSARAKEASDAVPTST